MSALSYLICLPTSNCLSPSHLSSLPRFILACLTPFCLSSWHVCLTPISPGLSVCQHINLSSCPISPRLPAFILPCLSVPISPYLPVSIILSVCPYILLSACFHHLVCLPLSPIFCLPPSPCLSAPISSCLPASITLSVCPYLLLSACLHHLVRLPPWLIYSIACLPTDQIPSSPSDNIYICSLKTTVSKAHEKKVSDFRDYSCWPLDSKTLGIFPISFFVTVILHFLDFRFLTVYCTYGYLYLMNNRWQIFTGQTVARTSWIILISFAVFEIYVHCTRLYSNFFYSVLYSVLKN